MSEYIKKRIEYVNNWPNSEQFDVENEYIKLIDLFEKEHKCFPYQPMQLWEDEEQRYNFVISYIIDSLDVLKQYPHHAFAFVFRGIDQYGKYIFGESNETICLKKIAIDFANMIEINDSVKDIFNVLFSNIPFSVNKFLYCELYKSKLNGIESKAYGRIIRNADNTLNDERKSLLDGIYTKFGYDPANYGESIRKGARLLGLLFEREKIEINGIEINISVETKMHLLLSGILYSLRNDYMHGLAISSGKSSMASIERYAMNYYCFLAASVITNILLIKGTSTVIKEVKYKELSHNVTNNINNMCVLFKKYMN